MKKIILSLSLLLLSANSYAFESGTYKCSVQGMEMMAITFVLKPNGRAKKTVMGQTERGNWQDDDDAAIIITKDQVIENTGNGQYVLGGFTPCIKIK